MLPRTVEPELMDDAEQAMAYAQAAFGEVNQAFVDRLLARHPALARGRVLDLGCGTGDILVRLLAARPHLTAVGLDGAPAMLAFAARAIAAAGLEARATLVTATLPAPAAVGGPFDAVLSNSLLHHLHDPDVLWRSVRAAGAPGAPVLVVDLARPESADAARALAERHAQGEHPVLQRDFLASLHAAFTLDEVRAQLARCGLDGALSVARISDRHLAVEGHLPG
jgi:SAM-dependent methyltransferase